MTKTVFLMAIALGLVLAAPVSVLAQTTPTPTPTLTSTPIVTSTPTPAVTVVEGENGTFFVDPTISYGQGGIIVGLMFLSGLQMMGIMIAIVDRGRR